MHTLEQQVVPSGITQSNITDQLLPEQPAQQADQQAPAPEEQAQQEPATAPAPEPPAGQPQETVALSATEVAPAAAEPQPEAQDAAAPAPAAPPAPAAAPAVAPSAAAAADSESDDDLPLAQRRLSGVNVAAKKPAAAPKPQQKQPAKQKAPPAKRKLDNGSASKAKPADKQAAAKPAANRAKKAKLSNGTVKRKKAASSSEEEEEEESSASDSGEEFEEEEEVARPKKQAVTRQQAPKRKAPEVLQRTRSEAENKEAPEVSQRARSEAENKEVKWITLEHAGVLFPPDYQPHGIKMKYEGQDVDLTPEQEEVATFYAVMIETDYAKKPVFNKNFWEGFKQVLGKNHVIQNLEKCDFRPIYTWYMADREEKKKMTKPEKDAAKAEKLVKEGKYMTARVDGKVEQVGNFRVEPPGLFRGRGEHPKMGKIKRRIYPKDVTINIGKDVPIPEHPYEDQDWREVRHDNTVTWLAFWHDPISPSSFKYVWLAANSGFKSENDLAKYEKARKLKSYIGPIRKKYEADWKSKDQRTQQIATALYFIDILALRAGHEKDEDEADTVGCCNLKAENVKVLTDPLKPNTIEFDFLGKDSVQYQKEVEVHPAVYKNISNWIGKTASDRRKQPEEQLFDAFDAQDLNKVLKESMEGLSAKVFRTYNASVTLDRLLSEQEAGLADEAEDDSQASPTIDSRKADYDRANKEVAILCNHQRAVGKAHDSQMEKMQEKLAGLREGLAELREDLKLAKAGKPKKGDDEGKPKKLDPDAVKQRIKKKEEQIAKAALAAKVKEDLKTVALGTSKINYLDPRISVAWCKRNEVPMEKIFNKSLLSKFHWAMDVSPEFRF